MLIETHNVPAILQAVMNEILYDFLNKFLMMYIDDRLIFNKDRKSH